MTGPIPSEAKLTAEVVAEGLAMLKPVIDDLLAQARAAVIEHGDGAEPWFAWEVEHSPYSRNTLAVLLTHFLIREAKRAVSDAG